MILHYLFDYTNVESVSDSFEAYSALYIWIFKHTTFNAGGINGQKSLCIK